MGNLDRKLLFSEPELRALEPAQERYTVRDTGSRLLLRVYPSGVKTFAYRYGFRGRDKLLILGTFDDGSGEGLMDVIEAELAMNKARAELRSNQDPLRLQRASLKIPRIQALIDEYIEVYAKPRKKSWREDKRLLEKHVAPALEELLISEITRRDLVLMLDQCRAAGNATHNRVAAVTSKLFRFAVKRGLLTESPATLFDRLPEQPRKRVLSDRELREFAMRAPLMVGEKIQRVLWVMLLTAHRRAEVCHYSPDQLVEDPKFGKVWAIPGEKTKTGVEYLQPVTPTIETQLERLEPVSPAVITRAVKEISERMPGERFTAHDLRRTASTGMRAYGDGAVVERILGHVPARIVRTYDRYEYLEEMRVILRAWELHLRSIEATITPASRIIPTY